MCRSRSPIYGVVLALLAVFSINLLAAWHSGIRDTDPIHAASVQHVSVAASQTDPDGPVHVAAHAATQWVVAPSPAADAVVGLVAEPLWRTYDPGFAPGNDPPALLRPPRG